MNINKAIVINLPEDTNRLKNTLESISSITSNIQIIKATKTVQHNMEVQFRNVAKLLGHCLSHLRALSFVEDNTLILEDDARLLNKEDFINLNLPEDWELCALGVNIRNKPILIKDNIYNIPKDSTCTFAYLIKNKEVADKIISHALRCLDNSWPDCVFDKIIFEGNYKCYSIYPAIFLPEAGPTTIWGGHRDNANIIKDSWRKYGSSIT